MNVRKFAWLLAATIVPWGNAAHAAAPAKTISDETIYVRQMMDLYSDLDCDELEANRVLLQQTSDVQNKKSVKRADELDEMLKRPDLNKDFRTKLTLEKDEIDRENARTTAAQRAIQLFWETDCADNPKVF